MPQFLYSVWFLDKNAEIDDQDREWIACLIIDADSLERAKQWGDHLATNFAHRHANNEFTSSGIETASEKVLSQGLPFIAFGEEASDSKIGW
jgi:hypothetical protein